MTFILKMFSGSLVARNGIVMIDSYYVSSIQRDFQANVKIIVLGMPIILE